MARIHRAGLTPGRRRRTPFPASTSASRFPQMFLPGPSRHSVRLRPKCERAPEAERGGSKDTEGRTPRRVGPRGLLTYACALRDARTRARRVERALPRCCRSSNRSIFGGVSSSNLQPAVKIAQQNSSTRTGQDKNPRVVLSMPTPSSAMLLARHVTLAVRGAARPFLATARGAQTRVAAVVPRCNHGGAGSIAVRLGPSRDAPTALSVGRVARRAAVSYAAGCVSPHRRRHGWTNRRAVGNRARPLVRRSILPRLLRAHRRYPKTSRFQPSALSLIHI